MKAYIRKLYRNRERYYVILGEPTNHPNNTVLKEEFYTRRMAMRFLLKHGYELVKRGSGIQK